MSQPTEPLQFMCPLELKDRLKEYADKNGLSMGAVTRLSISQYLNREEPKKEQEALVSAN